MTSMIYSVVLNFSPSTTQPIKIVQNGANRVRTTVKATGISYSPATMKKMASVPKRDLKATNIRWPGASLKLVPVTKAIIVDRIKQPNPLASTISNSWTCFYMLYFERAP